MKRYFYASMLMSLYSSILVASPVWVIEKGGNSLYLAGTVHMLRQQDYPLPATFEKAYDEAQILVFETDIGKTQDMAFQGQLIQALTLPENQTLDDILHRQTLDELKSYLKSHRLSLDQLSRFKPSMIAMTLTLLELKKLGVGELGVDQFYFNRASQDGKTVLALETIQQQLDFLASMGEGEEDLLIKQTLRDIKMLREDFSAMIDGWRKGDTGQLEALFVEPMRKDFAEVYQQMLVERNQNWMPKISGYLKTRQTEMVLVGSAHLIGNDGLLYMLEQKGYRVTQLD